VPRLLLKPVTVEAEVEKRLVAAVDKCSSSTKRKTIVYFANGVAESSTKLPETGTYPFVNRNSNNNR